MEKGFPAGEKVRFARSRSALTLSRVLPGRDTAPPMVIVEGSCQFTSGPFVVAPVVKPKDLIVCALNFDPLSRRLTVMSWREAVPVPTPVSGSELPLKVLLPKKPSSVSRKTCLEVEYEPAAFKVQSPRRHSESRPLVNMFFTPLRQASRKS